MSKLFYRLSAIVLVISLLFASLTTLTACKEETAEASTYLLKEDTVFAVNLSDSSIMNMPFSLFIDKSSNITVRADGTATITIKTTRALSGIANSLLGTGLAGDFVINSFIEMALEYIPGFSLSDMQHTFDLLQILLGLTLIGFDFDDPDVMAIFVSMSETGTLPKDLKIPPSLTLSYTADYYIKDIVSPYTGVYSGIYMGEHSPGGEPFVLMDFSEEEGIKKVNLRLELLKLIVNATEA